jgi:hypothetical protein
MLKKRRTLFCNKSDRFAQMQKVGITEDVLISEPVYATPVAGKDEKVNALACAPHDVGPQFSPLLEPGPRITKID